MVDNAVYVALSRQMAKFRHLEMTANNIANASTVGAQGDAMLFTDYLVSDGERKKIAFTQDISTYRDTKPGEMKATGNPLDVAIQGEGYFVVQTPLGERYTRAGNFRTDAEGTLVTVDGFAVLDEGKQPIQFQPDDQLVVINHAGSVIVDGEERGQLGVFQFENEQKMEKVNGTLLKTDQDALPAENYTVAQGILEGSNISPVNQMTTLVSISRSVGNTAKFIEHMYGMQRKALSAYAKQ